MASKHREPGHQISLGCMYYEYRDGIQRRMWSIGYVRQQDDCAETKPIRHHLPYLALKAVQDSIRVLDVLLRLLSHVEDRTVTARTQHVLVQRALTPLALCPQSRGARLKHAFGTARPVVVYRCCAIYNVIVSTDAGDQ